MATSSGRGPLRPRHLLIVAITTRAVQKEELSRLVHDASLQSLQHQPWIILDMPKTEQS